MTVPHCKDLKTSCRHVAWWFRLSRSLRLSDTMPLAESCPCGISVAAKLEKDSKNWLHQVA